MSKQRQPELDKYDTSFTYEEVEAYNEGEDVLTCPKCGDHFVRVDTEWYHIRGVYSYGSYNVHYWCPECSRELRNEEVDHG